MRALFVIAIIVLFFMLLLIISAAAFRALRIISFKKHAPIMPENFTVTAHTGCCGTVPNTIGSMEKGIDAGADIVEFDLNFDKDGEPVLSHDLPAAEAVSLKHAFAFLAEHKNIKANVDIKDTSNLAAVAEAAREYGVSDQIFFTGVFAKDVSSVERFCPKIPFYLNYSVNPKGSEDIAYLSHVIEIVKNCGAAGINMNYINASKQLVDAFHNEGLLVSIWTVNSKSELCRVLRLCPDNITTKRPERLCRLLKKI